MDIPAPLDEKWLISVWTHGEDLTGIDDAGMRIEITDAHNRIIDVLQQSCPLQNSFPWHQLRIPYAFGPNARSLRISLFMTVSDLDETNGRLWFDKFEINPARGLPTGLLSVVSDPDSPGVDSYALFQARPGFDMVSVPFRVSAPAKSLLSLRMRSSQPIRITAMLLSQEHDTYNGRWLEQQGAKSSPCWARTFTITPQWHVFDIPLSDSPINTTAKVVIRPQEEGTLHIDYACCHPAVSD